MGNRLRFYDQVFLGYAYYNLAKHYEFKKERFKCILSLMYSISIYPKERFKEKAYMILTTIKLI